MHEIALKWLLLQKQCDIDLPADKSLHKPNDSWAVFKVMCMYIPYGLTFAYIASIMVQDLGWSQNVSLNFC